MTPALGKRQQGFLLMTVVIFLAVLASIALMLSSGTSVDNALLSRHTENTTLAFVAEAGMEHAKWQLAQNTSCTGYADLPATNFAGDSYSATISPSDSSPVKITATGERPDGTKRTLTNSAVKTYQSPDSVTLNSTADTYLYKWKSGWNYGASTTLWVSNKWADSLAYSYLQFDTSSIPAESEILNASLQLWQNKPSSLGGIVGVHRVSGDWAEGTQTGGVGAPSWNDRDDGIAWATPGGDYDPVPIATASLPDAMLGFFNWDITPLVAAWVTGAQADQGLVLIPESPDTDAEFDSKQATNPTQVPVLTITYACECGKVCAAGTGGTPLLLVVGNASTLSSKDSDRKALMESWGYAVTVIDDDDSQANFDAALAVTSVVYVTDTVADGALGDKITKSPEGIVSEEGSKLDDFGFGSQVSPDTAAADQFKPTDAAHYISESFDGSGVIQFTSNITMPVASGTLAPDLQTPGAIGLVQALVTLGAGAVRWDGTVSAGRRVHLPFGAADTNQLTADGLILMQRALEWAGGSGCNSLFPLAMLVTNASALNAQEIERVDLLRTWCFAVTVVTASVPLETYDKMAVNFDIVYVPSQVYFADVTDKLKFQPIGVVNEISALSGYLGFTSGSSSLSGRWTDIVDNAHQITSPFSSGQLTITSSYQSMHRFVNSMGPGFRTLSTRPSSTDPMLMTLEAGDEILWGGVAAARRVMLPWGTSAFDIGALTADGQMILRRALEWAGGTVLTIDKQITTGNDDSEQRTVDGYVDLASTDLELGEDIDGSQTDLVGMRFSGIDIPQGSIISNAYIQFQVDEVRSGDPTLTLNGESADNAAQFTAANFDISSRAQTIASVPWDPPSWGVVGAAGPDQRTPNIAAIIQEIVSRPGWTSGNALVITVQGSGTRTVESYEGDAGAAPSLHVEFAAGRGGGAEPVNGTKIILSTETDATYGGGTFGDDDLATYDSGTDIATTHLDGNVFSRTDEDINAVHVLSDGRIILSTTGDAKLGGLSFGDDDLILYDPAANSSTLLLDGNVFADSKEDIDAVHAITMQQFLMSTETDAIVAGLSVGDDDLFLYDATNGTATLVFDGALFSTPTEDINAVFVLGNGHLLLSTTTDATLGGLSFGDDDLVEYDPKTGTATLFLDGSLFTATDEDIDAVSLLDAAAITP